MGQTTNGILYGVEAPTFPNDEDGEAAVDFVRKWEKAQKLTRPIQGLQICIENEGGKRLLGVWVAVGGSGEPGAAYFLETAVPLSQVEDNYAVQIKAATSLWSRFAAWAAKQGVSLGEAELWLSPCEVA